ncbi:MAG: hypothetical protein H7178_09305 [Chitinophagaceae bacterium]|nr:hypothetical protein [Chitinophagaceae bacterium]
MDLNTLAKQTGIESYYLLRYIKYLFPKEKIRNKNPFLSDWLERILLEDIETETLATFFRQSNFKVSRTIIDVRCYTRIIALNPKPQKVKSSHVFKKIIYTGITESNRSKF